MLNVICVKYYEININLNLPKYFKIDWKTHFCKIKFAYLIVEVQYSIKIYAINKHPYQRI